MIERLAQAIVEREPALAFADAMEWAAAYWDLCRIKQVRRAHHSGLDLGAADVAQLQQILATDRYVARAQSRRRRAAAKAAGAMA